MSTNVSIEKCMLMFFNTYFLLEQRKVRNSLQGGTIYVHEYVVCIRLWGISECE